MRQQGIVFFILITVFSLSDSTPLYASHPLEESLVAAWEKAQKSDSKTVHFDKVGDGRYKFATRYFPFDGELRLLNVFIEPTRNIKMPYSGEVEVELVGVSDRFIEKHRIGYSHWEKMNYFHYRDDERRWLTMNEFQQQLPLGENTEPSPNLFEYFRTYVQIFVLLFLFLSFGYYLRTIKIHLENNSYQWKTCIELLRKINAGRQFNDKINSQPPEEPDQKTHSK